MATSKNLFSPSDLPIVTRLLTEADLKLVDVGGRGGVLETLQALAPFSRYYVFEPEPVEAARLQQELEQSGDWRGVTVMSEAVGRTHGTARLYETGNPGFSSLLEPDPEVAKRVYLGPKFSVKSVSEVPLVTLDDAADRHGFQDATFLKLDTQGTELHILESGTRLLQSLVGVYTEANFQPFYKGQPLFGDLDRHLRQHGFSLFSLHRTLLRRSKYRKGMYSRRMMAWAHCLYLREPDSLPEADEPRLRRSLAGLLAAALSFHQYDLALEVAGMLERVHVLDQAEGAVLIDEIERCAARTRDAAAASVQRRNFVEELTERSFRDKALD